MKQYIKLIFFIKIYLILQFGINELYSEEIVINIPDSLKHVENPPDEYELDMDIWITPREKDSSDFHMNRFEDTYKEKIEIGKIYEVANEMIGPFARIDWGEFNTTKQKISNQLKLFLAALKEAQNAPGIVGPINEEVEQNIFINALNDSSFGIHSLQIEDSDDLTAKGYFKGTEDEFYIYKWSIVDSAYEILLPKKQVRQWRILENALTNLIDKQSKKINSDNTIKLENAVEQWDNFLDNGYSMMPWESLVNGWIIDLPVMAPPDHQWIFLHPLIGFELSVDQLDELRIKEALQIEVFGHLWYRGNNLTDFWGFSTAFSFREDHNPGIGAMVHIKRNWNLGITWHNLAGDLNPFLYFSMDLFSFAKKNVPEYIDKYKEIRTKYGLD